MGVNQTLFFFFLISGDREIREKVATLILEQVLPKTCSVSFIMYITHQLELGNIIREHCKDQTETGERRQLCWLTSV